MRAPQGISFSRLGCAPRAGQAMRPIAGALSLTPGSCALGVGLSPEVSQTIHEPRLRGRVRGQDYGQTTPKARNLLQLLMNQKSLSP